MLPVINVFGKIIPIYGLTIVIGAIVGFFVIIKCFSRYYNIPKDDILYALCYGAVGVMLGAKLLYLATNIKLLINADNVLQTLKDMFTGGFVFYGGLIGGILGVFIYSKQFKLSFKELILLLVPAIPLIHAFGRIGCLCAGCCYGIEYHGVFNIVFHNSLFAPNNVPLFPVQIVESICNLIIFFVLFITYKKYIGTYKTIGIYLGLYSITRFVLGFFRGDLVRGKWLYLSTSQWISVAVLIFLMVYSYIVKRKQNTKI